MANAQTDTPKIDGIAAANRGAGAAGSNFATPLNYTSVTALRTALAAANGAYYTSARLDSLTVNDMVWALRSIQDPGTIADYFQAQTA